MEGSSEDCHKSETSRGFNTPEVSDRNTRLFSDGIRSSGDASQDSGCTHGKREQEEALYLQGDLRRLQGVREDEDGVVDPVVRTLKWSNVSLRQWLDDPDRPVDSSECLHIFMQIVEIVNLAHSQGIVIHNVRPSCFVMSSFNHVAFIESASCSDSGSDSSDDGLHSQRVANKGSSSSLPDDLHKERRQLRTNKFLQEVNLRDASNTASGTSCLQLDSISRKHNSFEVSRNAPDVEEKKTSFPLKQILLMETNWYTSPEEATGAPSSCASDIYRLGVLLFELFCTFSSPEEKRSTMSSLRHRVLPPQLLLKCPKEASFCLWLLHPDPSGRPKLSELLQSDFLNEPRDNIAEREAAIALRERIEEQELLLEFLLMMQQKKQAAADELHDTISLVSSDIDEVTKHQSFLQRKETLCPPAGTDSDSGPPLTTAIDNEDSGVSGSRKRYRARIQNLNADDPECQNSEAIMVNQKSVLSKNSRLMKNFKKLESAYFLTRHRSLRPPSKSVTHLPPISGDGKGSIVASGRSSVNHVPLRDRYSKAGQTGWINSFLEGLCKYLSFSKLKAKADLKQGDLLNSSNLVCSVSFDRDGRLFATAGVNKKIKVFEYDTILNEDRDIHYPVIELASRSKLSSICWNSYIKSQIASSNFEGVVQVWDVTRGQVFTEMKEHERRVWSVDFSSADPTMLASGSDDGSVKLWNINQGASIGTIKTKANVCCVQFPLDSSRSLAFGSADHKVYYYDLRNSKVPLSTLTGHSKTVSYVKFIDSTTVVSASTDNTLKLWDLSMCTSHVVDSPLMSFTGHMNVKNFVGLSVSDGYIATGSETNEVFVYHKAFPMPAFSYKFGSRDPVCGDDADESAQFISSVCWRGQSTTLVAANSMGNIKVLEMA